MARYRLELMRVYLCFDRPQGVPVLSMEARSALSDPSREAGRWRKWK